jgi:hypothetical protein
MDASTYHDINSPLREFCSIRSNSECPILADTHTQRRGNFPFGCLSGISRG